MNKSMILSAYKPRVLRNGKIVIPKKKNIIKKKSISKEKRNDKLSFIKTSSNDISKINVKNKNELVVASNFNHILDNRNLYVMLTKLPPSVINKDLFNDQNNNYNKNYTKLEDYIQLNELQIYNKLEPKIDESKMLTATKKTKQTRMTSNSFNNKSISKTKSCDHSVINQTPDVRITRGKTIKLQTEERKQLDQIIFNKFPNNTFKMLAIQMYDINEEVKFLRTLGLICRFKCPLNCKTKKKKT